MDNKIINALALTEYLVELEETLKDGKSRKTNCYDRRNSQ